MKKRIGIITMHKVWNVGSALQAYATQKSIENLGHSSELIDYKYPNIEHRAAQGNIKEAKDLNIKGLLRMIAQKIKRTITRPKVNLYQKFYNDFFKCSDKTYDTRCSLSETPPLYDIYMTGSDQVWNPKYIGYDTNYFLDFAPEEKKKISYASSFSSKNIPSHLYNIYSEKLSKYDNISVRESSAQAIVKKMTGKNASVVCDPTLLLNNDDWMQIANTSTVKPQESYILVYVLGYAYNPYPEIYNYIERVIAELRLPVIYLNTIPGRLKGKYKQINIDNWGPVEFLHLVKNAKFIVTDSFHGTAFALNFGTPFISCVKSKDSSDSRMLDLLKAVKAEDRAVTYNANDEINFSSLSDITTNAIEEYRKKSLTYLKMALK